MKVFAVQSKAPELKRYLSWNSGKPHGQNAHPVENREQYLSTATRHGSAPESRQRRSHGEQGGTNRRIVFWQTTGDGNFGQGHDPPVMTIFSFFRFFFHKFLQRPFNGKYFLITLLMNGHEIKRDEEKTSYIVFQESIIFPGFHSSQNHSLTKVIKKIFSVEWPLQKVEKEK